MRRSIVHMKLSRQVVDWLWQIVWLEDVVVSLELNCMDFGSNHPPMQPITHGWCVAYKKNQMLKVILGIYLLSKSNAQGKLWMKIIYMHGGSNVIILVIFKAPHVIHLWGVVLESDRTRSLQFNSRFTIWPLQRLRSRDHPKKKKERKSSVVQMKKNRRDLYHHHYFIFY